MRRNVIYVIVLTLVMSVGLDAFAQKKDNRAALSAEQRVEMTAKRLGEKLMLDEKTKEQFVPLYKEYMQELFKLRSEKSSSSPKRELTDAQRVENLKNRFAVQAKAAEIKEKYVDKFAKILTPRQVEKVMSGNGAMKQKMGKQQKKAGKRDLGQCGACKKGASAAKETK